MFADDLTVIGVSGQAALDSMQAFIEARGVGEFPHIADVSGEVWNAFDITSQPAFVFVNDDGTVERTGSLGDSGIAERFQALVDA